MASAATTPQGVQHGEQDRGKSLGLRPRHRRDGLPVPDGDTDRPRLKAARRPRPRHSLLAGRLRLGRPGPLPGPESAAAPQGRWAGPPLPRGQRGRPRRFQHPLDSVGREERGRGRHPPRLLLGRLHRPPRTAPLPRADRTRQGGGRRRLLAGAALVSGFFAQARRPPTPSASRPAWPRDWPTRPTAWSAKAAPGAASRPGPTSAIPSGRRPSSSSPPAACPRGSSRRAPSALASSSCPGSRRRPGAC